MIVVIDSGLGNVGAIASMLKKAGHHSTIASDPEVLYSASHIILPGVGAFDRGIESLRGKGFASSLAKARDRGALILGICLGMQLLTKRSDEGGSTGLGWIDAETRRFEIPDEYHRTCKIPNMGWNHLSIERPGALFASWSGPARFYFVHSYRVVCNDAQDICASAWHGQDYTAVFQRENIFGVQFHPEKSHRYGLQLLSNFACLRPC